MPMTDEERRAKAAQRAREWRQANPEREKASKKAYRDADPERWKAMRQKSHAAYAERHRDEMRAAANAKRERLRAEAITAYGSECACPGCHVHHAELLTIDHTNGDGAAHRRALGRGSRDLYAWLKKNSYPSSFQLLCGSCNLAKSNKPQCPLAGQEH